MQNPDDETKSFLEERSQIDRLADRFEAAFRTGERPSMEAYIEDYLGDRSQLLRELLRGRDRAAKGSRRKRWYRRLLPKVPKYQSVVRSVCGTENRPVTIKRSGGITLYRKNSATTD